MMTKLQTMLHMLEQVCLPGEFISRKPQSLLRDRVLSDLMEEVDALIFGEGDRDWLFHGCDKPKRDPLDPACWAWIANRCSELIRLFVEPIRQTEAEIQSTLTAFAERHNATVGVSQPRPSVTVDKPKKHDFGVPDNATLVSIENDFQEGEPKDGNRTYCPTGRKFVTVRYEFVEGSPAEAFVRQMATRIATAGFAEVMP